MVTIVASDEDSLGANGFSRYRDKEAEECNFQHGCVEGFLKNDVRLQNGFVLYYEL
jgi:hypothetical protein